MNQQAPDSDGELAAREMRALLDFSPAAALIVRNSDGLIRYASKSAGEMFRCTPKDLIGKHTTDFHVRPEHRAVLSERMKTEGVIQDEEVRLWRADGTTFWALLSLRAARYRGEDVNISWVNDITRIKTAEAAREESERRFLDIAQASSDWFWETDADHRFTYISHHRHTISDTATRVTLGMARWDLPSPNDMAREGHLWAAHRKDLDAHRPFVDFEYSLTDSDGRVHRIRSSGVPVFGHNGAFLGYRGAASDVTARFEAEKAVRLIMEASPEGNIITTYDDGRILYCNRRLGEMLGYVPEALVGRKVHRLWDDFQTYLGAVLKFRAEGRLTDLEAPFRRADGSRVWLLVTMERTELEGQQAVFAGVYDITRRKGIEDAIMRSEARVRGILDGSPIAAAVTEPETGRHLFVNAAFFELLGIDPNRLSTVHSPSLYADPGQRAPLLAQLKTDGVVRDIEIRLHRPDTGAVFWALLNLRTIEFDGRPAILAWMLNIDRIKQAEETMRQAALEAETANRAKSEFLANMSHELRTPLNAIIGFSDVMMRQTFGPLGEPHYVDYAQSIHMSGEHLLALINDILDVSRIEAGRMELDEARVSVRDAVETSLHLIAERARAGGVELCRDIPADLPPLRADDRRVRQIVLNLLSNAVKFTPKGGTVTVTAKMENDCHVIRVIDTGVGMDPDELARSLLPFSQVDSGLNRKHEGTGLGLPLTRSLIELHGGTLEMDSARGQGTTATVRFPPYRRLDE